jgi:hypothetical protein
MANPNRTVAIHRAKVGIKPHVAEAIHQRQMNDEMVVDMGKFQRGEMTAEEFRQKHERA